jgi:threonine synthase
MRVGPHVEGELSLACFSCLSEHEPSELQTVCSSCGLPLRVQLQLPRGGPGDVIDSSIDSMWRYSEVLPIPIEDAVSLGEGWTPVTEVAENVFVKDESVNPTGSFKDRGMSMAVSAAMILGVKRIVAPSAGNAAVALSAYGHEAGLPVLVAMPRDTPPGIVGRCRDFGAEVHLVGGDISIAGDWLAATRGPGDFDVSTLKEPYRVEGKKTMGYEIWEQFGGDFPDYVIYPTGGGTGLIGMWKSWDEMEEMEWIGSARPKLVSVQAAGCQPIVKAYEEGRSDIEPWPDPLTEAWGLRVPSPIGGYLCLRAVRETGGSAVAVQEDDIHEATQLAARSTGIDFSPEGGAAWAAVHQLRDRNELARGQRVLIWNTGSGRNYWR